MPTEDHPHRRFLWADDTQTDQTVKELLTEMEQDLSAQVR